MKLKRFCTLFLSLITIFCFSACVNSEEKVADIVSAFNSFQKDENYVFTTYYQLHIGKKVVELSDIKYNGNECKIISLESDGAYAYSYMPNSVESDDQPSTEEQIERELIVNIVYLNYNDLSTNLIATINVSKKIVLAERYGDMLIFVENLPDENGENAKLSTYSLTNGQIEVDLQDFSLISADGNRSDKYSIEFYNKDLVGFLNGSRLKVTDKTTNESRILEKSILYTCEEGEKILSFGELDCLGFNRAFEKDGKIYVTSIYATGGIMGDVSHIFIVEYDYASHTVEYYTSVEFEKFPETVTHLYIF